MHPLLRFSDDLMLDIPSVDNQHKEIVSIINLIIKSLQPPRSNPSSYISQGLRKDVGSNLTGDLGHIPPKSDQYLDELQKLTVQHFLDEERLMKKIHYVGLSEHKREHLMLLAELKSYIRDIKSATEVLDMKNINALKSWFVLHIRSSDTEFSKAFRQAALPEQSESVEAELSSYS
ncbi:MAG: hemerythrin family protein [Candidatus Polarisedimenticolaceae bacterium]|nr:hemerythrin family protein [Candidatus Polarisedimenticolaceae bacterium]